MQTLRDSVRSKVEAMRQSGYLQQYDRSQLIAELSSAVAALSAHGESETAPGGPIHKCPWHTCANTRHG